jgi:RNA polymerase sigma factor (sigma-70 family)
MLTSPALVARTTDEELVEAVRDGSDEAFEVLVRRYRDRITAHVRRHVYDGQRADDIVQEVFVSALRGLRSSDQEITFRPWIYMIARNACIDHARRLKRSEEISVDSDQLGRFFDISAGGVSSTEITVMRKEELDEINQAFGALPDSQHRVLVQRELEGLSYKEIGRRMGLTPAAVESMLSRARTTLRGQYEEIASGARCARMRPVMTAVMRDLAGKRDRRTLARHVRHCRGCRHEALAIGLDAFVVEAQRGGVRGGLQRAAGIFPLGWFLRRPDGPVGALGGAGADQGATAVQKLVAVVAIAAVAGGGGVVAHKSGVDIPVPNAIGSSGQSSQPSGDGASQGPEGIPGQPPGETSQAEASAPGSVPAQLPAAKQDERPGSPAAALPLSGPQALPEQGGQAPPAEGGAGQIETAVPISEGAGELPSAVEKVDKKLGKKLDAVTNAPNALDETVDKMKKAPAGAKKKVDKKIDLLPDQAVTVTPPTVANPPSGIQGTVDELTKKAKKVTAPVDTSILLP